MATKTTIITDPRHPLTQNGLFTVYGDHDFPKTRSIKSPKAVCRRCGFPRKLIERQQEWGYDHPPLCRVVNASSDTEFAEYDKFVGV